LAFLNQKQDVFDIKLTSHGRKLLSRGKLKPEYYAFFDEDITYDAQATKTDDTSEPQNSIEKRIKEETPRMEALYNWTRLSEKDRTESYISRQKVFVGWNLNINPGYDEGLIPAGLGAGTVAEWVPKFNTVHVQKVLDTYDHDAEVGILQNYIWQEPLGTAKMGTQLAPHWDLQAYKGAITSTKAQLQNNTYPTLDIPQIDIEAKIITIVQDKIEYKNNISAAIAAGIAAGHVGDEPIVGPFPDGSFIEIKKGEILIGLAEENSLYQKENFDVEVFEIREEIDGTTGAPKETLRQLQFLHRPAEVDNFIKESGLTAMYPAATPNHVEYYFTLDMDGNIEDRIFCEVEFENKRVDLFADTDIEFDCIQYPYLEAPIVYSEKQIDQDGTLVTVPEGEEDPCE